MSFAVFTLGANAPHPITGERVPAHEQFAELIETAALAEELGFDAFGGLKRRPGLRGFGPLGCGWGGLGLRGLNAGRAWGIVPSGCGLGLGGWVRVGNGLAGGIGQRE
ncbi:hypothetical protein [Embleya sp. NBC_00896]|uniref:hypothetical protein n=1 Tax=Embleya sp. NBC_00896 TaxID=2975961 RepID=UPI003864CC9B|nr:hypothetical protein OG928_30130 [Embleya sp. NBC_00896]